MTDQARDEDKRLKDVCPNCGAKPAVGELVCHVCGVLLTGDDGNKTHKLRNVDLENISTPTKRPPIKRRTEFPEGTFLRLQLREVDDPMIVSITGDDPVMIGRRDKDGGYTPEIDMYQYAGFLLGVSRKHAQLQRIENQLMIEDIGSSNGTFIDGVRLNPRQQYQLYSGAHVRLGDLHFTIHF